MHSARNEKWDKIEIFKPNFLIKYRVYEILENSCDL